jgi:hypothetical protein
LCAAAPVPDRKVDWMGLRGVAPHSPSTPPDMRLSASGV